MSTAAVRCRAKLVAGFNACLDRYLAVTARSTRDELARRHAERGHDTLKWFTRTEAEVAEALANIIVPSDSETPGLDDIDVLGPPAIECLDRIVASCPEKQDTYARGLLSFDMWALEAHGAKFANLPTQEQAELLRAAQHLFEAWTEGGSVVAKAWRKSWAVTRMGSRLYAARLYPQIRADCLQVFYTSRVSWVWLEYDGPPMDEGYPGLAARRDFTG